jgi:hypothetical protein
MQPNGNLVVRVLLAAHREDGLERGIGKIADDFVVLELRGNQFLRGRRRRHQELEVHVELTRHARGHLRPRPVGVTTTKLASGEALDRATALSCVQHEVVHRYEDQARELVSVPGRSQLTLVPCLPEIDERQVDRTLSVQVGLINLQEADKQSRPAHESSPLASQVLT